MQTDHMSAKALFAHYFKELHAVAEQGDAREESFYPALASMLKAMADATGRKHVSITTLPKPTKQGTRISAFGTGRTVSSDMRKPRSRQKNGSI